MCRELLIILGQRGWQAIAGAVTAFLVARFLSPEEQGWYYTFIGIAALYSVFEMGLSSVLVQTVPHFSPPDPNWGLRKRILGEPSGAFVALFRHAVRAYFRMSIAFAILVGLLGSGFFLVKAGNPVAGDWLVPWLGLIVATAYSMYFLSFLAVLEGSGALTEVYSVRLMQGIAGSAVCWLLLADGAALWATVSMPAVAGTVALTWLVARRRETLRIGTIAADLTSFDWRAEVWPLQWRAGLSWISVYFMSQLATPLLFYFQGPVVAGQMGISLALAHMVGILSQSTLARRMPDISLAVAQRDWDGMRQTFRSGLRGLLLLFCGLALAITGCYAWVAKTEFAVRLLPPWQLAGLMLFVFSYQLSGAMAMQLRAFRSDPLVGLFIAGSALVVVGSFWGAKSYSSCGVIFVMLFVQLIFILPLSWWIRRRSLTKWCEV
jgi:hypothetical protein